MTSARYNHHLVILADGSVLAVGGASDLSDASATGVLAAEIWDPATETWHLTAPMRDRRTYQSTALLLPDGRVLVRRRRPSPRDYGFFDGGDFSPPYLFKGPRPAMTAAPALIPHRRRPWSSKRRRPPKSASVALIRPGSVTNATDAAQRYWSSRSPLNPIASRQRPRQSPLSRRPVTTCSSS